MPNEIAISLQNVGKMYRMYPSRLDMALDATGLIRLLPWRKARAKEYWALRNIDLEVKKGERLGIIGRNGAGKSTMLKLLTDNLRATEGNVYVNGTIQALLTSGSGFHPEFTGYENIRSSLVYQGLNPGQIENAVNDVAEFTELGDFLSQPFKVYSAGMQARLSFATATVLNPDILIVDEILGAGDAYFAGKSLERMKKLVEDSGATVLIVSHALEQILQYCDNCIWVERGKIVQHGPALEVIKAYQAFIHTLEDRRLKAENRQRLARDGASKQSGSYSDVLALTFRVQGEPNTTCDIAEISLLKNGKVEENLYVGGVQDTNRIHAAAICMENSHWSESRQVDGMPFRSLSLKRATTDVAQGNAIFDAYTMSDEAAYALQIRYRTYCTSKVSLSMIRNGTVIKDP
ncbi:MAG TPA: ABC transporter ATP-binding protein, partial [Anaerolineales bacterium]|nr:ABC transporter ATP-binding protein [Anaerolineales bacterium]